MNSPDHYGNNWEVGDFIRSHDLNFHLGNAIKYICRAELKGNKEEDLRKAIHYLENELVHTTITDGNGGGIPFCLQSFDEWTTEDVTEMFDR